MGQWIKAPVAMPDYLNLIPGPHMAESTNRLLQDGQQAQNEELWMLWLKWDTHYHLPIPKAWGNLCRGEGRETVGARGSGNIKETVFQTKQTLS